MLYYFFIFPIELILEICFEIINRISDNPGIAIIGVSIVVNFLMLPLYLRADTIQAEEKKRQNEMEPVIAHIRSAFKGDERFMMLQTYYRKQNYHPLYALRSSISLLLQIPFFIAAYHFLSNLSILNNASFLFINSLGEPDGLIKIGGISINLLPILMTFINCIATAVYTKGEPIKRNLQIYLLAGLFLVLLYPSPSGLVLYWTANNVFSLIKNLVIKDDPARTSETAGSETRYRMLYFGGASALVLLIGGVIPTEIVVSSPTEFVEPSLYRNPITFVESTFCVAAGFFLCWLSVFYYLSSQKVKRYMSYGVWMACIVSMVDYYLFARKQGTITPDLTYADFPAYPVWETVMQLLLLALTCVFMTALWKKKKSLIQNIYAVLMICFLGISLINIFRINKIIGLSGIAETGAQAAIDFPISRSGKNVVFIMLDGDISGYVPYMIAEKPELREKLSGFVYYPNTVSFGMHTNFAAPALFGGYEYTPHEINKRDEETLVQKHDESLLVLPVLFSEEGYRTTVLDPPLAGYSDWPDLEIYEPYPEISAYHARSRFTDPYYYASVEKKRRRSFFMYSIMRISPMMLKAPVYDEGEYLFPDEIHYESWQFVTAYSVLKNMINMTRITDSERGTFLIMENDTTHDELELQLPNYELSLTINNHELEKGYRIDDEGHKLILNKGLQYHPDMAALLRLGEWFDYLREEGVWDNTRIIIVSDHGWEEKEFSELILDDGTDMEAANPIFMFKDFNTEGFVISDEFMTNADAPVLALGGIIEDPVNPFTGNIINDSEKHKHDQYVTASHYNLITEAPNTPDAFVFTTDDSPWYGIRDDIFERSNWTVLSEREIQALQ